MKAEIITIGDEILLGQIVDTNSAWIAQFLGQTAVEIVQITSISDGEDEIRDALGQASARADLVIVTGGLGPTKDDVTKLAIAKYFQSDLVIDENVLNHVKALFARYASTTEIPTINYQQAEVLRCAEVLFNEVGTAPGMWVDHGEKHFVFMPGVPFEMKFLMEHRVLPKLKKIQDKASFYHAHIVTVGLGESFLSERISDIEDDLPVHIKLAYLPKLGMVKLRLSAAGTVGDNLKAETDHFVGLLVERLKDYYVTDRDIPFEEAVVETLTAAKVKVATAESCTGGSIAARITQISGASAVFDCGVVAYHNHIKEQVLGVKSETLLTYGAVSEQTVIEMAEGVKRISGANYGIATSGIAGPLGGTPEKPVGTVWIAVAGKQETVTKLFNFRHNRENNIEQSGMQALILFWKLFQKETGVSAVHNSE